MINKLKNILNENSFTILEGTRVVDINGVFKANILKESPAAFNWIIENNLRDMVEISLTNTIGDYRKLVSNSLENYNEEYKEFINALDKDEDISICVNIQKNIKDNTISIYDFNAFVENLLEKTLCKIMRSFSLLLQDKSYLILEIQDSEIMFCTDTMIFKGVSYQNIDIDTDKLIDRLEQLNKCKVASNFYGINEYGLIPNDFDIVHPYLSNQFTSLFEKIKMILSLAYISNTANIENDSLIIHIMGQRNVNYKTDLDIDKLKVNNQFYKIYKWVYTDGNPVDKAIIARSLISLHCKLTDLLNIDEAIFSSIKSNYELYQKDNVVQYLELKNKLSEYILDACTKINDISHLLMDRLKNNILAFLTFMLTAFLANLLSDSPLNNIFTKDVASIIYLVLTGSIIYLIISLEETKSTMKKLDKSYQKLKENYDGLLDENDIKNIFKDDEILNENKEEVKRVANMIKVVWIILILLCFIVTFVRSNSNSLSINTNIEVGESLTTSSSAYKIHQDK